MSIPAVGLDVDGVVANFSGYFISKLSLDPALNTTWDIGPSYGTEVEEQVYRLMDDPATWVSLEPLPGAVEAVSLLVQAGVIPVFITSMPKRFTKLREWWLERHFGPQLGRNPVYLEVVDNSTEKVRVAAEYELTHFVEDKPATANAMAEAGLTSILVPTTYADGDGATHPGVHSMTLLDFAVDVATEHRKVAA